MYLMVEPQLTQNTQKEWFVAANEGNMTVRQAEAKDFAFLISALYCKLQKLKWAKLMNFLILRLGGHHSELFESYWKTYSVIWITRSMD